MLTPSKFAYLNIRNYICSQIAWEKNVENLKKNLDDNDEFEYIDDVEEKIETYKKILNLLSDNKAKLTAQGK